MKTITNLIAIVFVLAAIAMIGAGVYYGFTYAKTQFVVLEYPLREILLITSIVFLLGIMILTFAMRSTGITIAKASTNESKHELYSHVLMVYRTLMDNATDRDDRRRLVEELGQIYADLLILSSGATLKSHMSLLSEIQGNDTDEEHLEKRFQQLLKNMRRDMGYADGYELNNLTEIFRFLPSNYTPLQEPQLER